MQQRMVAAAAVGGAAGEGAARGVGAEEGRMLVDGSSASVWWMEGGGWIEFCV